MYKICASFVIHCVAACTNNIAKKSSASTGECDPLVVPYHKDTRLCQVTQCHLTVVEYLVDASRILDSIILATFIYGTLSLIYRYIPANKYIKKVSLYYCPIFLIAVFKNKFNPYHFAPLSKGI